MNSYKTRNGVDVWVTRTFDCEPSLGGLYCQIYLDKDLERELDDFVIPAEVVNDDKEEEYILEFISNYCADVTYEYCPHCEKEVVLLAEHKAQICPNCNNWIAPCSLCKDCIGICTIAQECRNLNWSKIIKKELSREQWDLLGRLVLNEMTKLREFGNERGGMVRDLLSTEIGKLNTLYNFLIDNL